MSIDTELKMMIYGIDPVDIESLANTALRTELSQHTAPQTLKKRFCRFMDKPPEQVQMWYPSEEQVPPYRVYNWHFDANSTAHMNYYSSDSPLLRPGRIHATLVKTYNLRAYNPPQDVVVFAFHGQKAYTQHYEELMDNFARMHSPQDLVSDLLQIAGVGAQVFAPLISNYGGAAGQFLSPLMSNMGQALLGKKYFYSRR